jgi:hypothetical protein
MAKPIADDKLIAAAKAAGVPIGRSKADGTTLLVKVTCPRCWGTGRYSRCEAYQDRCFECDVRSGGKLIGVVWMNAAKWYRQQKRREAEQRRRDRESAKAAAALAVSRAAACYELGRAVAFVSLDELVTATREHFAKLAADAEAARLDQQRWFGREGESVMLLVRLEKVIRGGTHRWDRWRLSVMREVSTNSPVVWWNVLDADEGDLVSIRGTVKEHGVRDGEKQTVLTRVKVWRDQKWV